MKKYYNGWMRENKNEQFKDCGRIKAESKEQAFDMLKDYWETVYGDIAEFEFKIDGEKEIVSKFKPYVAPTHIVDDLKERGIVIEKTDRYIISFDIEDYGLGVNYYGDGDIKIYALKISGGEEIPNYDWRAIIFKGTKYNKDELSKGEIEELINNGELYAFNMRDLYREVYGIYDMGYLY